MISVLVVEDDYDKLRRIVGVVTGVAGIGVSQITETRDVASAKRLLKSRSFDLMILDIRIPYQIDGEAQDNGGIELLRSLKTNSSFNLPFHVIGVTAYRDLRERYDGAFLEDLWAIVQYDVTTNKWQDQLRRKVEYLVSSKSHIQSGDGSTYITDMAVITAMDSELKAIRNLPIDWRSFRLPHDDTEVFSGTIGEGEKKMSVVAAAAARKGLVASAVLAAKIIQNFRPKFLCMCGITAGTRGKVNIGDVIAAEYSWDWGSGKYEVIDGNGRFAPAPHQASASSMVLSELKTFCRDPSLLAGIRDRWPASAPATAIGVHPGPIASGASVLADPEFYGRVVEQHKDLVGVEMEIYAVLATAEMWSRPKPHVFALKAVSDFADKEKSDNYQSYSAYVSANLWYEFAKRSPLFY